MTISDKYTKIITGELLLKSPYVTSEWPVLRHTEEHDLECRKFDTSVENVLPFPMLI